MMKQKQQQFNRFLANGQKMDSNFNLKAYKEQVSHEVNAKYADALERANLFTRIYIRYKIQREIRTKVAERFCVENLYLGNKKH